MNQITESHASRRFHIGEKVRVKYGIPDPDYPDIPLGGWSGTIATIEQLDDETTVEIEWDKRTLNAMHPVYLKRCDRDDFIVETASLDEESIEPDDGTPVPIEQPTKIITRPLSEKNQDDRVRKILGLTSDDPLPAISRQTLLTYHRYLKGKLSFPFSAFHHEERIGPFARKRVTLTVTGLLDPKVHRLTEENGLICSARYQDDVVVLPLSELEVRKKNPNHRSIADYAYWFQNWPADSEFHDVKGRPDPEAETLVAGPSDRASVVMLFVFGIVGGIMGAGIGAAFRTFQAATPAALIGGIPVALIGALLLGRYVSVFGSVNRAGHGGLLGATLGLVVGAIIGVFAGLTILAFPWSLLGIVAGLVIAKFLVPGTVLRSAARLILGPSLGILWAAYRQDGDQAVLGAFAGTIVGALVGAGLPLALIGALRALRSAPRIDDNPGDEQDDEFEEDDDEYDDRRRRRRS